MKALRRPPESGGTAAAAPAPGKRPHKVSEQIPPVSAPMKTVKKLVWIERRVETSFRHAVLYCRAGRSRPCFGTESVCAVRHSEVSGDAFVCPAQKDRPAARSSASVSYGLNVYSSRLLRLTYTLGDLRIRRLGTRSNQTNRRLPYHDAPMTPAPLLLLLPG